MNVQRTLILVKPDAFARGLTGEILARFERKGLKIVALRSLTVSGSWPNATTPSTPSGRSSASWWISSPRARWWRWCSRATRRSGRAPGDRGDQPAGGGDRHIRGDFALQTGENMVHGSDSPASAERETALFFPDLT